MNLTFETEQENDGRWIAEVIEVPGVLAYGVTREHAIQEAEILAQKVLKSIDFGVLENTSAQLTLPLKKVVYQIFRINWKIQQEFGQEVSSFLQSTAKYNVQEARFDRQVSLSRSLRKWLRPELAEGDLILAWANLGALLEGTLKAFLTIYSRDFQNDPENHGSSNAIHRKGAKKGTVKHPGLLKLEDLITYFRLQNLFEGDEETLAKKIQRNRNSIHAFLESSLGNTECFQMALRNYLALQQRLYDQMPG